MVREDNLHLCVAFCYCMLNKHQTAFVFSIEVFGSQTMAPILDSVEIANALFSQISIIRLDERPQCRNNDIHIIEMNY